MTEAQVLYDIDLQVNTNGVEAITGSVLNAVLKGTIFQNVENRELAALTIDTGAFVANDTILVTLSKTRNDFDAFVIAMPNLYLPLSGTVGGYPVTGDIEFDSTSLPKIIQGAGYGNSVYVELNANTPTVTTSSTNGASTSVFKVNAASVTVNSPLFQFQGSDAKTVDLNTDNGTYTTPSMYLDNATNTWDIGTSTGYVSGVGSTVAVLGTTTTIDGSVSITITSPSTIFNSLTVNTMLYLNGSKVVTSSTYRTDGNFINFANNYGIDVIATGGSDVLNIGTTSADVINIGRTGATVNILGYALYEYQANQYVTDKLITINSGGAVASGSGSGFEIEENGNITGYFKTNGSRTGYSYLAPAILTAADISLASLSGSDKTFTLPNVNGTFLTTGNMTSITTTGTITAGVWNGTIIDPTYGGTGINNGARTITIAGNFVTTGAYNTTLAQQFTGTITLPGATATLATLALTETLTNKRITYRVTTISSSATPNVNTDDCDCVTITALAADITSMTTNLSGSPSNFQELVFRIKDTGGVARAITWGTSFIAMGVALPTTTVVGKILLVKYLYDSVTSKWGCVAVGNEA